ncbi:alkaline phosphatase D family protein [Acinetobacter sp. Ac_5812]|uniref:alkaline phosphatase D family protein n=1 Tax=Acinetobacter sp. Ac_5812 TaxID=1848937 RepID=UPI00148FD1D7|nr:alkaline phosphatase D family protein [Acinetobacter sp. Ac_5812]NNP67930.1 alkaline phosphatase [Acinetobacter sp. Ac_5812]
MSQFIQSRRRFLLNSGKLALGIASLPTLSACGLSDNKTPAIIIPDHVRPKFPSGIQIGDVYYGNATIWAQTDRAAKLRVEYDFTDSFKQPKIVSGAIVTNASDFTGRVNLTGLPENQHVFLRVTFEDATQNGVISHAYTGSFRTAPSAQTSIRFVWGGDVVGQGWGINPDIGGMKIWETMRQRQPNFFIHSGDTIYADSPVSPSVTLKPEQSLKPDELRVWNNIVTEEVSKVAESLKEFRGRYRYNFMDENLRRFAAEVPQMWQWDDHEITNNWSASKDLSANPAYTEKNINTLLKRGKQAFLEYSPMRWTTEAQDEQRIYRKISYGPLLDVFVLDMRSYRGANSTNLQSSLGADTAFMGAEQVNWLVNELSMSKAVWKVIAADMPIGLNVQDNFGAPDGIAKTWEAIANGNNGAPLGRELEIADLLSRIKTVKNIVWLTADVHYCAAHYYDNTHAKFTDFSPFWEFVAGPLNAGTFGPNEMDATFGGQVVFAKTPPKGKANLSPLDGYQFFGEVNIDPNNKSFKVEFFDLNGISQYNIELPAELS